MFGWRRDGRTLAAFAPRPACISTIGLPAATQRVLAGATDAHDLRRRPIDTMGPLMSRTVTAP
jgi:hypothetical protein